MSSRPVYMSKTHPSASSDADLRKFLDVAKCRSPTTRSRGLVFALDATASREPTWDLACHIQAEMFDAANHLGSLRVKLCFYRGFHEFHSEPWSMETAELHRTMRDVRCRAGRTQIERTLSHLVALRRDQEASAAVFVGDTVEEHPQRLFELAGELRLLGMPLFVFQEGGDKIAAGVLQRVARVSGGAFANFDIHSAHHLRDLLRAAAIYAAGGLTALEAHAQRERGSALLLSSQLRSKRY